MLCFGLLVGDLVWLACAVLGVAALAQAYQPMFFAMKYLGVAYLLYLAWQLWTAPILPAGTEAPVRGEGPRLLLVGLAMALGNPKTMLFYMALLPTIVDLREVGAVDLLSLTTTVTVIYSVVLAGYVFLAARARDFVRSPRARKAVNRVSGGVVAGAAATIALR